MAFDYALIYTDFDRHPRMYSMSIFILIIVLTFNRPLL